jgi:hypothetical protein
MEYYSDPYDPSFNFLKNKDGIVTTLDRGIISYEIFDDLNEKEIEEIYENSYVPITLTLQKNKNINGEVITEIREILKVVVSKMLHTSVDEIEVLERDDFYIFNPLTIYGTSVYENSKYTADFYANIKIEDFVGYTLLSTSPLTRFVIDRWVEKGEYLLDEIGVKYLSIQQEQISLIPLEKTEFIQRLDPYISKLIKEGYFAYIFGIFDLDDIEIIRELCLLYDIEIINSKDLSTLILRTNVDFKMSPELWLRNNLSLVKNGQFPIFSVSGNWMYSYENVYRRKYSFAFKDAILKYISYLAYARLSDDHEFIRPFTSLIKINEDLSIRVSLPSYKLVEKFKEYVEQIINNFYSYIICKDLKEGIVKRWLIQNVDNDSYPMIFKDKTGNEVLVHRSPLAYQYPSKFDFTEKDMIKGEKELTEKLREYYRLCHDNIEPVTLEEVDKMGLDELLNLVPITEDGITYCFSLETSSKIETNPITRRPLSEETLFRVKNSELGLRGLFNVAVLYGLYENIPVKIDIPTEKGIPKITRLKAEAKTRELVGNLFLIEILFSDETTTPLFEISLPTIGLEKIDELKQYVEKLWYKGYFFNYWYSAVNKYLDLSSFPVLITDPILLHAGDSIFDGNTALNYLKNAYLEN